MGFRKSFSTVSQVTDQAPNSRPRKRPARHPGSSEINGSTEDGTPGTSKLLALVDGPEGVNPGDEKNSGEELCRRMSLILYPWRLLTDAA